METGNVKDRVDLELEDMLSPDASGPDFIELNLTHRCDACTAAAVSQIEVSADLPHLLLCGHHTRKNLPRIFAMGYAFDIPDEYQYQYTRREIEMHPQEYMLRDAGSTV